MSNNNNAERFTLWFNTFSDGPRGVSEKLNKYLEEHPDTRIVSMVSMIFMKCYHVIVYMERDTADDIPDI